MIEIEDWKTWVAADLSPPSIALRTALTAVRSVERWLELCAFCLTA
jgi:hypothetical protein